MTLDLGIWQRYVMLSPLVAFFIITRCNKCYMRASIFPRDVFSSNAQTSNAWTEDAAETLHKLQWPSNLLQEQALNQLYDTPSALVGRSAPLPRLHLDLSGHASSPLGAATDPDLMRMGSRHPGFPPTGQGLTQGRNAHRPMSNPEPVNVLHALALAHSTQNHLLSVNQTADALRFASHCQSNYAGSGCGSDSDAWGLSEELPTCDTMVTDGHVGCLGTRVCCHSRS